VFNEAGGRRDLLRRVSHAANLLEIRLEVVKLVSPLIGEGG